MVTDMTNTEQTQRKFKKRKIIIPVFLSLILIIGFFTYPYMLARFGGSFGYTMELPFSNRLFYIDSNSEHISEIHFWGSGFMDSTPGNRGNNGYTEADDEYDEIIDILNSFRYSHKEIVNSGTQGNHLRNYEIAFDYVGFWFSPEENTIFVYTDKAGNGIRYYSAEEGYFDRLVELGSG